ncbi:hypothetical protein Cme02nite_64440 [Catellatospora methionotrophica]|uniref:Uncharacterized protein n=1 Tax=Catellatospora methionotrophica TaxID=121620 RepID=A0A8J3LF09_9ACTN|nr:hypothetical protein [Catellatospora methionotrophica]GIG18112.1 hypothetical protein Cme02nite_64440 [Catellatospora methionotrophica]
MPDDSGTTRDVPTPGRTHARGPVRQVATAAVAIALLPAGVWLSAQVRPGPALHDVALFAHLGFLILGFGAVLVADYFFALWVLGRTTLAEAMANTSRLHLLVWSGVVGLIGSGALLRPDLGKGFTILKLVLVAALVINGTQAMVLDRRIRSLAGRPPVRLLLWGALTAVISQVSWWGAVVIGYLNTRR